MNKNKLYLLGVMCLPLNVAWALEPLDDQTLSSTTGQDGINIGVTLPKVDVGQVALIDKDGVSSKILGQDYNQAASITLAGTANAPVSVSFKGADASPTINAIVDSDAGTSKAFANVAVSFGNQISGIKVSPFGLYAANTNQVTGLGKSKDVFSGGVLNAGVKQLMQVGSADNNFEINFVQGNSPRINIQLGDVPQSQMIKFSGAIQSICGTGTGCPIAFISGDTSAQFNFQMKGTAATGINLNGFYAGVQPTGVVFGNTGTSSKVDVAFNNVLLGRDGAVSTQIFNALPNGSMGNFGAVGASVKDLKVSIRGL